MAKTESMKRRLIFILLMLLPSFYQAGAEKLPDETRKDEVYASLHLGDLGLSYEAYKLAVRGLEKLKTEGQLLNNNILTIIDFTQSSNHKRMYVIDLYKKTLLYNTYVAHGRNTGGEYAEKFSNTSGSFMSSLGFYITQNIAIGPKVGLSVILKGIEKGINDKAQQREIIVHGADYATESFIQKNGRLGRSYGCPSLPPEMIQPVAETIKGGSCLFIYKNDRQYLHESQILK